MQVQSYGTSSQIKLPGAAADQPNIYAFGTSYQQMHAELQQADAKLYARNGVLAMLQRNMGIKHAPQRWQESRYVLHPVVWTSAACEQLAGLPAVTDTGAACSECFDCIVTFEERVVQSLIAGATQLPGGSWLRAARPSSHDLFVSLGVALPHAGTVLHAVGHAVAVQMKQDVLVGGAWA